MAESISSLTFPFVLFLPKAVFQQAPPDRLMRLLPKDMKNAEVGVQSRERSTKQQLGTL